MAGSITTLISLGGNCSAIGSKETRKEYMEKIATTIEESRRLLELGINPDTADMRWRYDHNAHRHDDIPQVLDVRNWDDEYNKDIPAWSLDPLKRMLERIRPTRFSFTLSPDRDKWICDFAVYGCEVRKTDDDFISLCVNILTELMRKRKYQSMETE